MNSLRACGIIGLAVASLVMQAVPGSAEETARRPAHARSSSHVYVFRGFLNVFSPGMDTLAEKIQQRGIRTTVHTHGAWAELAETAIENYRAGRERLIIVIGHSFGAGAASAMAERLGQSGVPVKLLVTFDPVVKLTIPANVSRAYNFYVSDGIGVSTDSAVPNRRSSSNVDRKDLGHISITTAPDLQRRVLGYVLEATRPSAPQPATPPGPNGDARPQVSTAPNGNLVQRPGATP
jgi:pimeloyl-ACP methyl ester carboxylesterase